MPATRSSSSTWTIPKVRAPSSGVAATGICASGLKYLALGSTQIAGYDFACTLTDGTAVAVEGIFGCSSCEPCESCSYNLCDRGEALGLFDPGPVQAD